MTSVEKLVIKDPTSITLLDRAKLYKTWLAEFALEVKMMEYTNDTKTLGILTSLLAQSQKQILPPVCLHRYIRSTHTKLQIEALQKGVDFYSWLAVDGSVFALAEIKSVLMETVDTKTENDTDNNDMEEDRELDSDNDELLWGYNDEDWKRNKHKGEQPQEKEGDWMCQWNARKERTAVRNILNNAKVITDDDAEIVEDICSIDFSQRRDLYRYWIVKYREELKRTVNDYEKHFNESVEQLKEVRESETFEILEEANVIGMTTTGAAKHRKALQRVKPSIVIVEEAAEVLESHIITALSDGCKHLILIGDHKQLRPSTTVYELAKRYELDISLFERMVKNDIPCVTLLEQHRMRPEISILLKNKFLYPNLSDHKNVLHYGNVLGVDSDVFFIEHDKLEVRSDDSTSYHNPHEATFLAGLCRYLLLQGYDPTQITVLSPYMGQVSLLRKAMPKRGFEGVRITAVDNYQGEENDIILLSLVRSIRNNLEGMRKRNPIGFLAIPNRICVALSRAKMGFYVIGNFSLLKEHSELWQFMVQKMADSKRVGPELILRCENHPENIIKASQMQDFDKAPDGGCKEPCGGRLKCSHLCPRVCHVVDKEHKYTKCWKPCVKIFKTCGHKCLRKCHEDCGTCKTKVQKQLPMCSHSATMLCHKDAFTWNCEKVCDVKLPCGHECKRACSVCTKTSSHENKCKVTVSRELPCGHTMDIHCFQDPNTVICAQSCSSTLMCGHPCSGSCGACLRGKIHKPCTKTCRKVLACGHKCSNRCSDLCPPCSLPCEWVCSHGKKCNRTCSEECDKCIEDCFFKCPHSKCTRQCHEMCDSKQCNEKCRKKLACGHPCTGLCSESCICSEFCAEKENKYSSIYEKGTVYIRLARCKCIVPQNLLDLHINTSQSTRNNLLLRCPDCKKPISSTDKRYSNALKQRRQNVVDQFNIVRGSVADKKLKGQILQREILRLGISGLGKTQQLELQSRLQKDDFGNLHILNKSVELLNELLPAYQKLKKLGDSINVIAPDKLVEIITRKYKIGSTQLWYEIGLEVKRIIFYVELKTIQKNASVKLTGSEDAQKILLKTLAILNDDAPIDDKKREVIERVISRLK